MDQVGVNKALVEARALVAELEAYDGTDAQRQSLLKRNDKVRMIIEEPYDIMTRWWIDSSCAAAMNLLLRQDAFEKFPLDENESITVAEIASSCRLDASVTARALRVLVANGIFRECGKDEFAHNSHSRAFGPTLVGGFITMLMDFMTAFIALPDYFQSHEPSEVQDYKKTPFAFAAGSEGKTYYEVLDMNPKQRDLWNVTLQNMSQNFPIIGLFPFEYLEEQVKRNPERPFVVDIAGGRGQALLAIQKYCGGNFGGKMILQDTPSVINTLLPDDIPGIQPMIYDIFDEQPVKGAHVYFMRRLLHDFYDPEAIKILKNTVPAMAPESRLVICDMLVPDRTEVGGPMTLYWLDWFLLAVGGKERSSQEFQGILDEAGLELVKLYSYPEGTAVMLETRVRQGRTAET